MDTLRLVLILVGLLIIASIYIYTRLSAGQPVFSPLKKLFAKCLPAKPAAATPPRNTNNAREQRYAADVPADTDIEQISKALNGSTSQQAPVDEIGSISTIDEQLLDVEPLVIVFNIMAKDGEMFAGPDILDACLSYGFIHGDMNIFHLYPSVDTSTGHSICSLANTIEPGYFDLEHIESVRTPGLSLFMQLPGPVDGRSALEHTLKVGRMIAEQLNGDLCDESRSVLTLQTIGHIKEKIEAGMFKARMAQVSKHRH